MPRCANSTLNFVPSNPKMTQSVVALGWGYLYQYFNSSSVLFISFIALELRNKVKLFILNNKTFLRKNHTRETVSPQKSPLFTVISASFSLHHMPISIIASAIFLFLFNESAFLSSALMAWAQALFKYCNLHHYSSSISVNNTSW